MQFLAEFVVLFSHIFSKINGQDKLIGLDVFEISLKQIVQLIRDHPHHGGRLQVLDVFDTRNGLVPPGFGQQRHIVPARLVFVFIAQVKQANVLQVCQLWPGEVVPFGDHLHVVQVEFEIFWVGDYYNFFHFLGRIISRFAS